MLHKAKSLVNDPARLIDKTLQMLKILISTYLTSHYTRFGNGLDLACKAFGYHVTSISRENYLYLVVASEVYSLSVSPMHCMTSNLH